jgi:hypothetical protein
VKWARHRTKQAIARTVHEPTSHGVVRYPCSSYSTRHSHVAM